jgi:hypothetical protein
VTDLGTLVEPLKRELAIPGEFATLFPNTSDDDLGATLADGFSQAQLDGYFNTLNLNLNTNAVDPDVSLAGGALIVLYAASQIIRAQLRAMNLNARYKAGPVEYETSKSAVLLRDELKYLIERRKELVTQARSSGRMVYVIDNYVARMSVTTMGGFYGYELERP